MTKLLEQVKQAKFLDHSTLPTFADSTLAALAADQYRAAAGAGGYKEPAELTELQWDTVLKNNRALHAYYTDFDKGIVVKAPKPAFRLRGIASPGTPAETVAATDLPADGAKEGVASQVSKNTKLPEPVSRPLSFAHENKRTMYWASLMRFIAQPKYNPSIPPYYIYDTASVSVTEIRQQQQRSLIKEGFNSLSVSGSL